MGKFFAGIKNLFTRQKQAGFSSPIPSIEHSGNYDPDQNYNDDFYENLQKTIAWTEDIVQTIKDPSTINYTMVLRKTNPLYEGKPFYRYANALYNCASTPDIPFDYYTVLNDALKLRQGMTLLKIDPGMAGKILKFEIDVTTLDGAPCAESGFVDGSDIPPIDTWFHISKKYLYCWIPTLFIGKMQEAIDVEILGSYSWLEETDPELNFQILKRLG